MGINIQLRSILDQLIDDNIKNARNFKLMAKIFKPFVGSEDDFAFGSIIEEIVSSFSMIFVLINKRSIKEEELIEVYNIIMSRAEEIYSVLSD
ncbi:MAG: hypothetical protein QW416_06600 [Candidatus Nitrosocaldaceae archaeon]